MKLIRLLRASFVLVCTLFASSAIGEGAYFEVNYPASSDPKELQMGVTYTLWVPEGVRTLRGIIVHQHGCGEGACRGGATAAYDLHWQALAKKWDCALLGPSYQQREDQDCQLWCDPRKGSRTTFLRSLSEFAAKSGHPEIEKVPWCLWGHSGGGTWAGVMQILDPERIVAIWFRSGTALGRLKNGFDGSDVWPAAAYEIPITLNPGRKEKGDKQFAGAWTKCEEMFMAFRAKGAPAGFAPDPRTSHECGDSRYLAIPFFDACLAQRLPSKGSKSQTLRQLQPGAEWLGILPAPIVQPRNKFEGRIEESSWLPNKAVALAWMEYVQKGSVQDTTKPPTPRAAKVGSTTGGNEITWDATADLESGIGGFVIERDGKEIGRVPTKPIGRFGRPLFQTMSYHDTPEKPKDGKLPEMRFVDSNVSVGEKHAYRVRTVNSVGLVSNAATAR